MPYIDPKTIEQVREIDLLTYLRENEPDELVKLTPSTYCTRTHDSLKISNGKWYWWRRGFGGKKRLTRGFVGQKGSTEQLVGASSAAFSCFT